MTEQEKRDAIAKAKAWKEEAKRHEAKAWNDPTERARLLELMSISKQ